MDFHTGLEEHPNPAPLQKGNGTRRRSFPASAAQLALGMLCFHGMPGASCALWGKGECSSRPRFKALLLPSPKALLEKQNSRCGAAWLAEAQQGFLQMQSPREGCEQLFIPGRTDTAAAAFGMLPHPIPACPGNTEFLPCLFPAHRLRKLFSPNSYFSSRITDFMVQIS